MEKLKGLLKNRRRSGGDSIIRTAANNFAEMEVVSDPENTPENMPTSASSSALLQSDPNPDTTRALMMDKIEQLTNEKYSMEETLSDIRSQLARTTEENLTLQSKCDDLQKSLELEKRRSKWQQKFYEKRITQLTGLPTKSTIDTASTSSSDPNDMSIDDEGDGGNGDLSRLRKYQSIEDLVECNTFYEETIKALVQVQESQAEDINSLRKFYEDKLKALSEEHEADITEILESSNEQVEKLIKENESLIRDLLTGCEGLFDELKVEYTEEARTNSELKTSSGANIIVQFKALPTPVKGIVVAGITVISIATAGWASWGFIIWVWPRLIAFAEILAANPETSLVYLLAFLNSVPFQSFINSWEEGKSLGECLKAFANTEFLSTALRMAPDLFTQFKRFQRTAAITH